MQTPEFLVIGAGLIGVSLARELARVSRSVLVLDRGPVGAGASSAAAGLLAPTFTAGTAGALLDLCQESAAGYEDWVHELRQDGAGDVGFRRPGLLDLWTGRLPSEGPHGLPGLPDPGRRREWLSGEEVCRREPNVIAPLEGAGYYPDDAQVDPARLVRGVARVAELAGAAVREGEPVLRLERHGDRITTVHTPAVRYHPGCVVVTAGAWSGGLFEPLGVALPVFPVKGQLLLAECRLPPVRTPLFAGDALFVPRPDGGLVLGVTVEEEAGFDERVTLDGVRKILSDTSAVVPAVGRLPLARAWAGLRPATPDGWPFMGPVPPLHNLWASTGHFRKGILLAPACARLMAQSLLANHPVDALAPFKPTRRVDGP